MTRSRGFTLIELITVIAILGALAVIALPKYIDLQTQAQDAAAKGVAGSLTAGTATNLAGAIAGNSAAVSVQSCANAENTLSGGALPTSYSIRSAASFAATQGSVTNCKVVLKDGGNVATSATFQAYATP